MGAEDRKQILKGQNKSETSLHIMPTEVLVMQAVIAVGESEEGLKRKQNWNGSFSKFGRLV